MNRFYGENGREKAGTSTRIFEYQFLSSYSKVIRSYFAFLIDLFPSSSPSPPLSVSSISSISSSRSPSLSRALSVSFPLSVSSSSSRSLGLSLSLYSSPSLSSQHCPFLMGSHLFTLWLSQNVLSTSFTIFFAS